MPDKLITNNEVLAYFIEMLGEDWDIDEAKMEWARYPKVDDATGEATLQNGCPSLTLKIIATKPFSTIALHRECIETTNRHPQ